MEFEKKQQTIPKNRSRYTQKTGNVKCNKTIIALHFVQYDVLWSTEKQYWPRPSALVNGLDQYCFSVLHSKSHCTQWSAITVCYYIDRFKLWGFIREINSGISHVKYHFFFHRNYFYIAISELEVWWLRLCCATVNTHTIVNWKRFAKCHCRLWHIFNMTSLTSYEDFQFERKDYALFGFVYTSIFIKFSWNKFSR